MNQGFQQFLQKWYQTPKGQKLLNQESRLVEKAISNLFGYYLVQLGGAENHAWMDFSRVSNKLILDDYIDPQTIAEWKNKRAQSVQESHKHNDPYWVKAELDYLPFRKDSVDVMVLPHTLETVSDPYYLLRQVDTNLMPEGHIVLTGFNPLACAILKAQLSKDGKSFREANLVRSSRVTEWLKVLGYEIEQVRFSTISCFTGTTDSDSVTGWRLLERTEKSLSRMGVEFGNVYCIVARKRVDSPKLVGAAWKKAPWLNLAKGNQVVSNRNSKSVHSSKCESREP
ncbi:MAG: methyltransferase domain-containing protein [Thiotrichales bacterium]|nr:methyltransferase domain-containing protein [Thiotrichales bacterium]